RGVLLESLRPWGAVWAITGTTLAFAAIHFAGLMGGATLEATLAQVLLGGIPFGLAFAGLRLATRSIWPLITIHAVNNFTSYLMSGHWEAVSQDMSRFALVGVLQLGLEVVLVGYGVWFLWRFSRNR
ncbi:MAG TPA: CPBP family intramembrane glutamic endopeptidase, partial [Candidatus Limnocylindrales bacterium]|nr:CPBP family intramembrane glutamic endopeptidase [Candidatus Limnocylindrales bacterium]